MLATERRRIQSSGSQGNTDDTVRRLERELQDCRVEKDQLHRRAEELQRQMEEFNGRVEDLQSRVTELQRQVVDSNRQAEESDRRCDTYSQKTDEFQRRAESAETRVHQLERSLADTTQDFRQNEQSYKITSTHWEVRREEIELTGPELGVGGWATVTVAKFRGAQVAVKTIHNQIISPHNIQLLQREMNIAASLHHPNLIQFIEATIEGEMMIVMELMTTSLTCESHYSGRGSRSELSAPHPARSFCSSRH